MKAPLLVSIVAGITLASVGITLAGQSSFVQKPAPGDAPEFVGGPWLNAKDGKPVTLASRRGKPTLVAFWTFACSNCQANIPAYARLVAKYRPKGVELIAVHTPELRIERNLDQVKAHVAKFAIDYPVLVDNDGSNWNRWKVQVWPTIYVIDGDGNCRYRWVGELAWKNADGEAQISRVLDQILAEKPLPGGSTKG